ncbi:hypothetical protein GOODEAATRI_030555, partial [Goodea atripinnis]
TYNSDKNQLNQTAGYGENNACVWWGNAVHPEDNTLIDVLKRWETKITSLHSYNSPADTLHVTLNYLRSPEQGFQHPLLDRCCALQYVDDILLAGPAEHVEVEELLPRMLLSHPLPEQARLWGAPYGGQWCPRWSYVGWNTGPGGCTTPLSGKLKQLQNIGLVRGKLTSPPIRASHTKVNPLLLTVENLKGNVFYCGKHPLNNCQKRGDKGFYLILGVDVAGTDRKGLIRFNLVDPPQHKMFSTEPKQVGPVQAIDIAKISYPNQLQLETGYSQVNTWLSLVQEAAYKAKKGN